MPEWLKGADCKSVAFATLVQIQLGPFKILNSFYYFSLVSLKLLTILFVLKSFFNNLISYCLYIIPFIAEFKSLNIISR